MKLHRHSQNIVKTSIRTITCHVKDESAALAGSRDTDLSSWHVGPACFESKTLLEQGTWPAHIADVSLQAMSCQAEGSTRAQKASPCQVKDGEQPACQVVNQPAKLELA